MLETDLRRELYQGAAQVDIEDILRLLPHRGPNLLVDRVLTLIPGRHAVGVKSVSGDEYGLASRGHAFVFPSTFALEGLAQLAAIVDASARLPDPSTEEGRSEDAIAEAAASVRILGAVHSFEVRREMLTSEPLYLTVDLEPTSDDTTVRARGRAIIHGETFAEAHFELVPIE